MLSEDTGSDSGGVKRIHERLSVDFRSLGYRGTSFFSLPWRTAAKPATLL